MPAVARSQTIAITGGKVYPVSGPPIENGTVIIANGKITAVGGSGLAVPARAQRIDAAGKWVTPGLVNAATILGVQEIGFSGGYQDASARGDHGIAASFRSWDGLNPSNTILPSVRKDGLTTVAIVPGRGFVQGQAAVIDLVEGSAAQMLVKAPVAMVGDIGNPQPAEAAARGELVGKWRELLRDVKTYSLRRVQYDANQSRSLAARRVDLEALISVVNGTMPLWLVADRASDIDAALALAKEFTLKIVIVGGAEAWQVADRLAAAHVPVMTGAMNNIPSSFSTLGQRQENAGLLRAAGVTVVLIGNGAGDEAAFNASNLRYEAGNAVAYGMKWDDALRSAALTAAEVLGVADKVGSLQPGRSANVVIWSGDPLEFATRAEHVYVRGVEYSRPTREEELTTRYKTKPPTYRVP
ncbi:MAG TPA: amidohydrolase family protein [Gemmatimonadaceae bacterium]|nr:amidohydrolase family protein [Gemmatimonadaceae bacterium]